MGLDYPNYEVLVVVDGSTDATAKIPRGFPGRLLFRDRLGVSRARNVGLGQAEGEVGAHIDADARADPDWFTYRALALEVPKQVCIILPTPSTIQTPGWDTI
jgi:glycosyltransferase involved in cell wall biosynthesis